MKKFIYTGPSVPDVIDKKEVYLKTGEIYEFNPELPRVKTLLNFKYLKAVVEAQTKTIKKGT